MTRVYSIVVLCLFICEYANSNLIHGRSDGPAFDTKEISIPEEDIIATNELTSGSEPSLIPEETTLGKKCAQIGEFCMNNSDCCSDLCMGFLKKCVSGSG